MPWVVTLTILVASAFLMDMSFTMITPFLPVYLSSELGAKASEVDMWSGAVFAVTFFVSGLLGPVWGVLADRKSRKLMALRASIGLTISYALCGIVQTPMQLFAARFFQGLCAGLYPALLALLAASIPARKTGLSMGLMQGGMTVGAVVGPFVGGVLADYFGMRESFFVASIALGLISLLIGFCIKEKPRTVKVTSRNWFDWSVLRQPAIFKMLISSADPAALHCSASGKHGQHHDAVRDDLFCLCDFDHDCVSDSRSSRSEVWILKSTFLLFILCRPSNLCSGLRAHSV